MPAAAKQSPRLYFLGNNPTFQEEVLVLPSNSLWQLIHHQKKGSRQHYSTFVSFPDEAASENPEGLSTFSRNQVNIKLPVTVLADALQVFQCQKSSWIMPKLGEAEALQPGNQSSKRRQGTEGTWHPRIALCTRKANRNTTRPGTVGHLGVTKLNISLGSIGSHTKKSVVVKVHIEVDVYFPAAFIYYLNNVQNLLEDVSWEVQEWTPSY